MTSRWTCLQHTPFENTPRGSQASSEYAQKHPEVCQRLPEANIFTRICRNSSNQTHLSVCFLKIWTAITWHPRSMCPANNWTAIALLALAAFDSGLSCNGSARVRGIELLQPLRQFEHQKSLPWIETPAFHILRRHRLIDYQLKCWRCCHCTVSGIATVRVIAVVMLLLVLLLSVPLLLLSLLLLPSVLLPLQC